VWGGAGSILVNLETKEKSYTQDTYMCRADGYVCFKNSELMCGRLGKATLGGGNKSGLFQVNPSRAKSLFPGISGGPRIFVWLKRHLKRGPSLAFYTNFLVRGSL
jgi:hypothetical protein